MVVRPSSLHKHIQGEQKMAEQIEQAKYAGRKVHEFKIGKSVIKVIEPPPMTQEEIAQVLDDMHTVGWAIIEELVERGESV